MKNLLPVFLVLSNAALFAADPVSLAANTNLTGRVEPGTPVAYEISLNAGDFAAIRLDRPTIAIECQLFDERGQWLRTFSGPAQTALNVVIAADNAGVYRLDVKASDPKASGGFTIGVLLTLPLSQRAWAAVPPDTTILSPWFRGESDQISTGKLNEDDFWRNVAARGTPIIEETSPRGDSVWVTWLWRGAPDTRNVLVDWFPFALARPSDDAMARFGSTGIWYKTLSVRRNARFVYQLVPNDPFTVDQLGGGIRLAAARADPLNSHSLLAPGDQSRFDAQSIATMPAAPHPDWLDPIPGAAGGEIQEHEFHSDTLGNTRRIFVYTPVGYQAKGRQYPALFLTDGADYLNYLSARRILDNLIHRGKVPPLIAILIDNVAGMRNEELTCNPKFAGFLKKELLPWVHAHYAITGLASRTTIGGFSLGGLNATCTANQYPESFGNVLSQSGSYWWSSPPPATPPDPSAEPNQMARVFIRRPRLPLRFFLTAGAYEIDPTGYGGDVLLNNKLLRDVLLARGYPVTFELFYGGHDYQSWDWSFGDGLMALLGRR